MTTPHIWHWGWGTSVCFLTWVFIKDLRLSLSSNINWFENQLHLWVPEYLLAHHTPRGGESGYGLVPGCPAWVLNIYSFITWTSGDSNTCDLFFFLSTGFEPFFQPVLITFIIYFHIDSHKHAPLKAHVWAFLLQGLWIIQSIFHSQ